MSAAEEETHEIEDEEETEDWNGFCIGHGWDCDHD